jgi:transcriptional regulator with XRE-family HTH domain
VKIHEEEIFSEILQEERKARKISQIENGKRSPTFSTILKICSSLEITPSELFSIYEKRDSDYKAKKDWKR